MNQKYHSHGTKKKLKTMNILQTVPLFPRRQLKQNLRLKKSAIVRLQKSFRLKSMPLLKTRIRFFQNENSVTMQKTDFALMNLQIIIIRIKTTKNWIIVLQKNIFIPSTKVRFRRISNIMKTVY